VNRIKFKERLSIRNPGKISTLLRSRTKMS
jgi:hypothetical protein